LLLTLYRISQEALTNVARHANARQAVLRLQLRGPAAPGAPLQLAWSVTDDGIGVPAPGAARQRGNGIAGIQERVWAQGGDLRLGPARPGSLAPGHTGPVLPDLPDLPGLCLQAGFSACWLPVSGRMLP
jgi:two-component system sensor histidine kinase UhpB